MASIVGSVAQSTLKTTRALTNKTRSYGSAMGEATGITKANYSTVENELPIHTLHDSYNSSVDRGCACDERLPENRTIEQNGDVYATRVFHSSDNGASAVVFGAPSSGSRFLKRKERQTGEVDYWNHAQPMVSQLKGPQVMKGSEHDYWTSGYEETPSRGCVQEAFSEKTLTAKHDERSCMSSFGIDTSYKYYVGGGYSSGVDLRRNCDDGPCLVSCGGDNLCTAPQTVHQPMTETMFWGQAKTHGVNTVPAGGRVTRWEQGPMVKGTLSTREYEHAVHRVKPMYQADTLPTQNQIEDYWTDSDARSRIDDTGRIKHAPERSCWPMPGGYYNSSLVGKVQTKQPPPGY